MTGKRKDLRSAASSFLSPRKETTTESIDSIVNTSNTDDTETTHNTVDIVVKKPIKKSIAKPMHIYANLEVKEYLRVISWYDRSNSMSDYVVKLIEKDALARNSEYQEALKLINK